MFTVDCKEQHTFCVDCLHHHCRVQVCFVVLVLACFGVDMGTGNGDLFVGGVRVCLTAGHATE